MNNGVPQPDAELLALVQAGQQQAFETLYDRYEQLVFRFLQTLLKDHQAAEDALQETFLLAFSKGQNAHGATFRGWLFTVAHQQAMLYLRRNKRTPSPVHETDWLASLISTDWHTLQIERSETAEVMHHILQKLPQQQQAVIRLRYYEGMKFREVAAQLGCPLNTALARLHDGLNTLRTLWHEHTT